VRQFEFLRGCLPLRCGQVAPPPGPLQRSYLTPPPQRLQSRPRLSRPSQSYWSNPVELTFLAAGLMLEHVGRQDLRERLERGLDQVLNADKVLTGDLGGKATTKEFTQAILHRLAADT
jgi:hypothetical protein